MCRFAAYLGQPIALDELLYRPEHSIIDQSVNAREGTHPLNGDGFGVGWYVPDMGPKPALYRNVSPAWSDRNMKHIAPRVKTPLFFAHVRGASDGMEVQLSNCHPFVSGRLLFMHNGYIEGHEEILRPLRRSLPDDIYFDIEGTTDSEHLFGLIQDELGDDRTNPSPEDLASAVKDAIGRVEDMKREQGAEHRPTKANVALTDGRSMVALRYNSDDAKNGNSLYVSRAGRFVCEDGQTRVVDPDGEGAVLVSSEQMMPQEDGLDPVPGNHMLIVEPDRSYRIEPVPAM